MLIRMLLLRIFRMVHCRLSVFLIALLTPLSLSAPSSINVLHLLNLPSRLSTQLVSANSSESLDHIVCSIRCYEKGKYYDFHVGAKDTSILVVSRDFPVDFNHHMRLLYDALSLAIVACYRVGWSAN